MGQQVVTTTLAEEGTKSDTAWEAVEDEGFFPSAPLTAQPAAYAAGTTYAKGALVTEGTQVYRSQQAGNKGHEPKADTDFEWWAPVSISTYPLQNPAYNAGFTSTPNPSRKEP